MELGWKYIIVILLAILLIFFVTVWYTELGAQMKEMLANIFNVV